MHKTYKVGLLWQICQMMHFRGRYCKLVFLFWVNVRLPRNWTLTWNSSLPTGHPSVEVDSRSCATSASVAKMCGCVLYHDHWNVWGPKLGMSHVVMFLPADRLRYGGKSPWTAFYVGTASLYSMRFSTGSCCRTGTKWSQWQVPDTRHAMAFWLVSYHYSRSMVISDAGSLQKVQGHRATGPESMLLDSTHRRPCGTY